MRTLRASVTKPCAEDSLPLYPPPAFLCACVQREGTDDLKSVFSENNKNTLVFMPYLNKQSKLRLKPYLSAFV